MTNFEKIREIATDADKLAGALMNSCVGIDAECKEMYNAGECPYKTVDDIENLDESVCRACVRRWLEREAAE